MPNPTIEQARVLNNDKKNLIVSASAGSGKTWVMIEYITKLIVEKRVPVRRMLILTFTRAAAGEMRERLNKALLNTKSDAFIMQQIDDLSICDVSTIDAFCEKLIKRNIDKLELDETFRLLDEPLELKRKAFELALNNFAGEELNEIYYSFRKNKDIIFEAMLDIDDFFAVSSSDKSVDYYIDAQENFFEEALKELNILLKTDISRLKNKLENVKEQISSEQKYTLYIETLLNLLSTPLGDDFIANVQNLKMIELPSVPVVRGEGRDESLAEIVKAVRKEAKDFLDGLDKYDFTEPSLSKQKKGTLAAALLKLYKVFAAEYASLKQQQDLLDFVELEKLALKLMQDSEILAMLQEQYDYVFVDEYQDTNRIQESIVKPITSKGHFVAVGDPKQGIYGFRNATMEIMQEDVASFQTKADGAVEYLRGNFRSDDRLLSFVNRVFEKVMTEKSVGIDYRATSMLKGEVPFEKNSLPSVRVDIVDCDEKVELEREGIYSVREDELYINEKNKAEVAAIIARIDELLTQKIYDAKLGKLRDVEFDDIAILLRSRSSLMGDLARELGRRGYPVLSDLKELEIEEPEVQMLVNLLKLLLNRDDDIALLSVLGSQLGGLSMDELASLRINSPNAKSFYEIYESSALPKIAEFNAMLDSLKLSVMVNGLYQSFIKLLTNKDYFAYLKRQDGGRLKLKQVYNFLHDLKVYDRDIPSAISYFTEIGGRRRSNDSAGGGAIKLMTIHASKGLEYPIVILAGAGQKLESPARKNYALNTKYGIATYAFNERNNTKAISPNLEIVRRQNARKEMIDEIMIFYVALTRAKNVLDIIGKDKLQNLYSGADFDPLEAKNYLALIFYAFGRNALDSLASKGCYQEGDFEFNYIDTTVELLNNETQTAKKQLTEKEKAALEEYFNFNYPLQKDCLYNVKNSVTALNALSDIAPHSKVVIEEERQDYITQGNAYHEAMKLLDFAKINSLETLEAEIERNRLAFTEGYIELIDKNILFKNICLINALVKNAKVYKEKQFVMAAKLSELFDSDSEEEVLVQGVVDFFALGGENILIDYKFTQEKNSEKILKKYSKQLQLYSKAIENAFDLKLNKKYILSLKNSQLIEYLQ